MTNSNNEIEIDFGMITQDNIEQVSERERERVTFVVAWILLSHKIHDDLQESLKVQ